jgi:NitT/TauT family transport system substrate-binding protein
LLIRESYEIPARPYRFFVDCYLSPTHSRAVPAFCLAACLNTAIYLNVYKFDKDHRIHRHVDEVYLYLQWFDQAQFAGFYVAQKKKFYDDLDLKVTIIARPEDLDIFYDQVGREGLQVPRIRVPDEEWNAPRLVSATTDSDENNPIIAFGVWTGDQVLKQYRKENLQIRAIGAIFDRSLACFMVRDTEKNRKDLILSPADFRGKKVGVYKGYDTGTIYRWLMRTYNPNPPPVEQELDPNDDNVKKLQDRTLDVLPAYVINEPFVAHRRTFKTRLILPESYNLQYYSDTLIVNSKALSHHTPAVERFLEATENGWRWALENQSAAADLVVSEAPNLKASEQLEMLNRVAAYIQPNSPMFEMSRDTWESMSTILAAQPALGFKDEGKCGDLCDFSIVRSAHVDFHKLGK